MAHIQLAPEPKYGPGKRASKATIKRLLIKDDEGRKNGRASLTDGQRKNLIGIVGEDYAEERTFFRRKKKEEDDKPLRNVVWKNKKWNK